MAERVSRAVKLLRRRAGWRQSDLGAAAAVSREMVSRLERGGLDTMTIGAVRRIVEALDGTLLVDVRWRGELLSRLIDATHAALQEHVAALLSGLGWLVRVEVSFNRYGDRGRCDVVAFHPATGTLLIVEIKSTLVDLQDAIGRLDVKARVARHIAAELGWPAPSRVAIALVVHDGRTARRIVASHPVLFARFTVRGRAALRWLRAPDPSGAALLWFTPLPDSHGMTVKSGQRLRRPHNGHQGAHLAGNDRRPGRSGQGA